jgi:toxin-antitoxin system PIN domain toxin
MSATVDANILVYASNESDPAYARARAVVERLAAGPDLVYLFWPAIMGYLRIVTDPRILPRPLTFADAAANISALLERPHIQCPGEAEGFWELYRATAGDQVRANDVADAHLAALMRQHGVGTIYSRDRGFRLFDGISAHDPIAD